MVVYFSKTELGKDLLWHCTIPPKGMEVDDNGNPVIDIGLRYVVRDSEFEGYVEEIKTNGIRIELKLIAKKGMPSVGRAYRIEKY